MRRGDKVWSGGAYKKSGADLITFTQISDGHGKFFKGHSTRTSINNHQSDQSYQDYTREDVHRSE
jgi:hypothetical protein